MGPRTDSLPRRGERPLCDRGLSSLCFSPCAPCRALPHPGPRPAGSGSRARSGAGWACLVPPSWHRSCQWLWSLRGFGPSRSGALPAVGVVAPRRQPQPLCSPGKQLPISRSGQLPQGQKLKNKQKPKLLMTCGWRGLRVPPPGARRKGWQPPRSSLAPAPEPGLAPGLRAAPTASPPQEPDCRLRRH